jgi:hypothetical protein
MWQESVASDKNSGSKRPETRRAEYGDFQTPLQLGREICDLLARRGLRPSSILEPNCGKGSFLTAARESFPNARSIVGVEINPDYVEAARYSLAAQTNPGADLTILLGDFFKMQWHTILESLPDPLLILGNPPWVTNADLGILGSSNLPAKSNFQNHRGLDAMTGKSNFDISEFMLIREMEWISGRNATLAMICKTGVARKVLRHAWKSGLHLGAASIYRINAGQHFGVAVEACVLMVQGSTGKVAAECLLFDSLGAPAPTTAIGPRDERLVADTTLYDRWKHLEGKEHYTWRSGIKHDCARVMELRQENGAYRNGLDEIVDVEEDHVYPMLKSSDLAAMNHTAPRRFMLVTQRHIGEDTGALRTLAPKTWEYLLRHAALLDARSSSVYRRRPRFSIFGVGEYSFSDWKVAISGFYKKLDFRIIGPHEQKPVVLDDTCNFLPCDSQREAELIGAILNSTIVREYLTSRIFWDEKRPITLTILSSLNLLAAAKELDLETSLRDIINTYHGCAEQLRLFS